MCTALSHGNVFWQLTDKYEENGIYQAVVMTSCGINTIFFFLMWRIKELQMHPMKLFMLITGSDAFVLYNYNMSKMTCKFNLQRLFMWTTQFEDSCESELRSLQLLITSTQFIVNMASLFALLLQICVALDLILTI